MYSCNDYEIRCASPILARPHLRRPSFNERPSRDELDGLDAVPGDGVCEVTVSAGDCSLRAAVTEANAAPLSTSSTIQLAAAVYTLTGVEAEDANHGGDLDVYGDMVIEGNGATIDGQQLFRVLDVHSGATLVARDLTLRDGTGGGLSGGLLHVASTNDNHTGCMFLPSRIILPRNCLLPTHVVGKSSLTDHLSVELMRKHTQEALIFAGSGQAASLQIVAHRSK